MNGMYIYVYILQAQIQSLTLAIIHCQYLVYGLRHHVLVYVGMRLYTKQCTNLGW